MSEEKFLWNGNQYSIANGIQMSVGERLLQSMTFRKNMDVLDAGCGSGNLSIRIGEQVPEGHVLAVDLSESMIQKCNELLREYVGNNVEFRVCGINDMTFEEKFDVVFSNSVLHWVTEIDDAVRRFYRVLRTNGSVGVQIPLLNERHPLVVYADRAIAESGVKESYIRWRFPWYVPKRAEDFAKILTDAGFQEVVCRKDRNLFRFESAEAVYLHFKSVGLELYTAPLSENLKEKFMRRVMLDLKQDFPESVSLDYERIFAYGRKLS